MGNIIEIIGAVVDVEFQRDSVPKIYDALKVKESLFQRGFRGCNRQNTYKFVLNRGSFDHFSTILNIEGSRVYRDSDPTGTQARASDSSLTRNSSLFLVCRTKRRSK